MEMKQKDREIQRIDEKIKRLLIEREQIKQSKRIYKQFKKICKITIFRLFGWKIVITRHKGSGAVGEHQARQPLPISTGHRSADE